MAVYPFFQVDAFTDQALGGNPCAILMNCGELDELTMQALALEMNLSETAFILSASKTDIVVRYFTPAEEIPFAGHPTIATCRALIDFGKLALEDAKTEIKLHIGSLEIPVSIQRRANGQTWITMTQPEPQFLSIHHTEQTAKVFGLLLDDILSGYPIQTVSTGTPQLMIPVRDHAKTFARHFGLPPDTIEDPFTGSATGAMAAYLWQHNLLDERKFIAEQGHWMNRPGRALVEIIGRRDSIQAVKVSGQAVTIARGEINI
jgi:trans-2,3-dihydro-3-hydroxyanthranilate isomerase